MVASDRTYISSLIAVLYLVTAAIASGARARSAREGGSQDGCRAVLWRLWREGVDADARGCQAGGQRSTSAAGDEGQGASRGPYRPTLLLRTLADRCAVSNGFGAFVSIR